MKEGVNMPDPTPGEGRDEFASRCIPIVLKEEPTKTQRQAAGKCYGIYDNAQKQNEGNK